MDTIISLDHDIIKSRMEKYAIKNTIPKSYREKPKLIYSLNIENDKLNKKYIKTICKEVALHNEFIKKVDVKNKTVDFNLTRVERNNRMLNSNKKLLINRGVNVTFNSKNSNSHSQSNSDLCIIHSKVNKDFERIIPENSTLIDFTDHNVEYNMGKEKEIIPNSMILNSTLESTKILNKTFNVTAKTSNNFNSKTRFYEKINNTNKSTFYSGNGKNSDKSTIHHTSERIKKFEIENDYESQLINNMNLSSIVWWKQNHKEEEDKLEKIKLKYELEMKEKSKVFKFKAHLDKVKSVDEKKYDREVKNIMFKERLLKQLLTKPTFVQDDFIRFKIKSIRQATFNLDEIMKKINPLVNKMKINSIMDHAEEMRMKNKENIMTKNFRNLKYRLVKEIQPNLSSCFNISSLSSY